MAKRPSRAQRNLTRVKAQLPFASLPPPPQPPQLTETEQGKIADLQQAKVDRRTLGKTARRDRRAAYGAARMLRAGLGQARSELQAAGLTGPELDNAIKEFTARQVDAIAGAQLQSQTIRTKYRQDRTQANADITKLRAEKQSIFSNLRSQASQDQADYQQKVGEAGLKSQEAALTGKVAAQKAAASAGKGGLTPTQRRAQQTALRNARIGLISGLRKMSEDQLKAYGHSQALIADADAGIPGADQSDVARAFRSIQNLVRAAQTDPKARQRVEALGIGGWRAQHLLRIR